MNCLRYSKVARKEPIKYSSTSSSVVSNDINRKTKKPINKNNISKDK
jgi:hypothetical protein